MTVRSITRRLMCVLLAVALCAPVLAIAAPGPDRGRAAELCALPAHSFGILLARAGNGHQQGRHRPSAPSFFTLVPLNGRGSDSGRLAAPLQTHTPHSVWAAAARTGRSPPTIS
jgi:hypothetical protein